MQSYPEETKVFVCTRDTVFRNQHYHTGDFLVSNRSDRQVFELYQ